MPLFKLAMNEKNLKIAQFIEDAERAVKISRSREYVKVEFKWDITVARFMLEGAVDSLTDREWQALIREIKQSLKGAKIRSESDQFFTIQIVRQHCIGARVSAAEKNVICKAAELEHESPSIFIRKAALKKAERILERRRREMRIGGDMH